MASITPESVLAAVHEANNDDVDGVFVSCTNLHSFSIIDQAEAEIGKPSSHQIWRWPGICCDWPMLTGRMRRCPGVCLAAPARTAIRQGRLHCRRDGNAAENKHKCTTAEHQHFFMKPAFGGVPACIDLCR